MSAATWEVVAERHSCDAFGLICAATDLSTNEHVIDLLMAARSIDVQDFDDMDLARLLRCVADVVKWCELPAMEWPEPVIRGAAETLEHASR